MNDENGKPNKEVTRRQMLMRLGLAATAVYAAPVLLQLSEARASSFSASSNSGPSGRRRRRRAASSGPSFSGVRRRRRVHGATPAPRRRGLRFASSFSR